MRLNEKKILITEIFFHCDKQPTIIQQIRMLSWSVERLRKLKRMAEAFEKVYQKKLPIQ